MARPLLYPTPDPLLARRRTGLDQVAFANLLGVHPCTVQRWERGKQAPRGAVRLLVYLTQQHPEKVLNVLLHDPSPTLGAALGHVPVA